MSVTTRTLDCTPDELFAVLADPWVYPTWVVGASRMRGADTAYPAPGAKLHHSIGVWPFVLDDETIVEVWAPPHRMVLTAKTRPAGEERVILEVKSRGAGCVVRMKEYPVSGLVRLIPKPIADALLHIRNLETLRRLEWVAKGRAGR